MEVRRLSLKQSNRMSSGELTLDRFGHHSLRSTPTSYRSSHCSGRKLFKERNSTHRDLLTYFGHGKKFPVKR